MRFSRTFLCVTSAVLLASVSYAQDSMVSPEGERQNRITSGNSDTGIMTTHKPNALDAAATDLPWQRAAAAPAAAPAAPTAAFQPIPFGRGEAPAPIIPDGPRSTVAVPVVDVQAMESAEASPPTPSDPQADPAKEDPANPTELTSPIFGDSDDKTRPRKIILRLLNKVTAQSQVLTFKPNEMVKVGTLEITAIACQTSAPQSQTDYAGLIDIVERLPTSKTKPLFRGWMYASSPSITALEHPVYDVTMVECQTPQPKKEEKPEEKPAKKGKK